MSRFCGFDLETTISSSIHGPDGKFHENDFVTVIYGNSTTSVKAEHNENGYKRRLPQECLSIILGSEVLIGHNIKFDLNYIWNNNPEIHEWLYKGGQIWDTQLVEYLISGQRHQYPSLAEVQKIRLGIKVKKDRISRLFKLGIGADKIIKAKNRCKRLYRLYTVYCIDDVVTVLNIFKEQVSRAKSLNMMPIIKLYNKYLLSIISMENNGLFIDVLRAEKTQRDFYLEHVNELNKAIKVCEHLWPIEMHKFNPNSNKDASLILFGGIGKYSVKEQTGVFKNGNHKFSNIEKEISIKGFELNPVFYSENTKNDGIYKKDKEVISKIYSESNNPLVKEYCDHMQTAAKYRHMCSTYIKAFIDRSVNGILHPNINNTATITSRLSSSAPNIQNLPKRDPKMKKAIMGLIKAPPGWRCVSIDFSQLEIFIEAYLSNDPKLIEDLMSGIDFHVLRLSYIEPLSYDEIYKLSKEDKIEEWCIKRDQAKELSYQKAYGAFVDTISESSGIPKDKVEMVFKKEDERYPFAKDFNDGVEESANKNQTIAKISNISSSQLKKIKSIYDYELLPMKDKRISGHPITYDRDEPRHLGWYTSPFGKRYVFDEQCTIDKNGKMHRRYESTKIKNYPKQGTAGDIQGITSVGMYQFLYKHRDVVKLINEVHDSKWFYIKESHISLIIPQLCTIMCKVNELTKKYLDIHMPFDFRVDVEIGDNFGEMSSWKRVNLGEESNDREQTI